MRNVAIVVNGLILIEILFLAWSMRHETPRDFGVRIFSEFCVSRYHDPITHQEGELLDYNFEDEMGGIRKINAMLEMVLSALIIPLFFLLLR